MRNNKCSSICLSLDWLFFFKPGQIHGHTIPRIHMHIAYYRTTCTHHRDSPALSTVASRSSQIIIVAVQFAAWIDTGHYSLLLHIDDDEAQKIASKRCASSSSVSEFWRRRRRWATDSLISPWRQVQNHGKPCPDGPDSRENDANLGSATPHILVEMPSSLFVQPIVPVMFFLSNTFIRMPEANT